MPENNETTVLLEDLYNRAVARGDRDDPLTVRVGEALAKLKPAPKAPEHTGVAHTGAKPPHERG